MLKWLFFSINRKFISIFLVDEAGEEFTSLGMSGIFKYLLGRAALDNLSVVHINDLARNFFCKLHFVGDDYHRHVFLGKLF